MSLEDKTLSREDYEARHPLRCSCRHIDGSMSATEKSALLEWLREEPEENVCKILFNVRCLSEGVDVPALDAVMFLSPRKSQVEVVQTVGRIMRIAPGKARGYVILPIVTSSGIPPEEVVSNNKDFEVVWQVLRALKSIDPDFGRIVDGQLGKIDSDKIEVISVSEQKINRRAKSSKGTGHKKPRSTGPRPSEPNLFEHDAIVEENIRAQILRRVGNRREWGDWAEDVAQVCGRQVRHIQKILDESEPSRKKFAAFREELEKTLCGALRDEETVEMLGQHVVTTPILDALFTIRDDEGKVLYQFSEQNPIAKAMTAMVKALDGEGMKTFTASLEDFYDSVKARMKHVTKMEERQTVIKELFEKFFKAAFPKLQEKLGIVYTPVEIVDFINRSVGDLLEKEFGVSISDTGVHVLDPFSGTGTFLARLMQSGMIPPEKLPQKFAEDLHANEILPLAYYVSSMNLEGVFHELCPKEAARPNEVMVWTDTFADHESSTIFKTSLQENNDRLRRVDTLDLRVILGNPPYSVGQKSANDDNQNEHYETLDRRIAETYAANSTAQNKNSLYDSYCRAFRWASDRIGESGIVAFVTNAGYTDSLVANGMRLSLAEEFNSIYVYHLKGNALTQGEERRKERENVFGEGSRAPVAITVLVKNPKSPEHGVVRFHAVPDYLTREEKLADVAKSGSVAHMDWEIITTDRHGDWFNQRSDAFAMFMPMGSKKDRKQTSIFSDYSNGVKTGRDAWAVNASMPRLRANVSRLVSEYNRQLALKLPAVERLPQKIKWTASLENRFNREEALSFREERLYESLYRPFDPQHFYFSQEFNERVYKMPALFPRSDTRNLIITVCGVGASAFSVLMSDRLVDLHFNGDSQCFPLYLPEAQESGSREAETHEENLFGSEVKLPPCAVTDGALQHFAGVYGEEGRTLTKEALFYYIYGLLHSEDYRERFANNLQKELPRIPRVSSWKDFRAFEDAGRRLARLHVHFDEVKPFEGVRLVWKAGAEPDYRVLQMKWGKIAGKKGNAAKDKTRLIYNETLTIEGIPLEAQDYVINKKSALDWVVERVCRKVDKETGILNDFNDYGTEKGNPRYPLDLFLRVITISLETMKIVRSLPRLDIHAADL